jgi:hypothetical protein
MRKIAINLETQKRNASRSLPVIYINFSFDFLGLDKVYFKNYFANELI